MKLCKGDLEIEIEQPGTYYKGTRFEWAGVFSKIKKGGHIIAGQWFEKNEAFRHDNVCACSEEFSTVSFDENDCVHLKDNSLVFCAPIPKPLPSVYMGEIHKKGTDYTKAQTPYEVRVYEGTQSVHIQGSEPLHHCVFWSNRNVACIEPHVLIELEKGQSKEWTIEYQISL